jgi:hypothetical protein
MARSVGAERRGSALFAVERPPRLVLRFAVVLSIALGLASALILIVVHHFALSQAERAATRQAGLLASTVFQREVGRGDVEAPVTMSRRKELDALLRTYVLAEDIVGLSLVRGDGLVTYSTDHRAIGTIASGELASEAAAGTILSRVSASGTASTKTDGKTLETYAPVGPDANVGAALIAQSYEPIAGSARALQLRVGAVLEALLIVLFAVLVPLLIRVTRRIQRQIERIHRQAFYDRPAEQDPSLRRTRSGRLSRSRGGPGACSSPHRSQPFPRDQRHARARGGGRRARRGRKPLTNRGR